MFQVGSYHQIVMDESKEHLLITESLAALAAGLMRVDLAVGELALGAATAVAAGSLAADGATLLAGLVGVNLAVGELGLLGALVGLAVLAETTVLCCWS